MTQLVTELNALSGPEIAEALRQLIREGAIINYVTFTREWYWHTWHTWDNMHDDALPINDWVVVYTQKEQHREVT